MLKDHPVLRDYRNIERIMSLYEELRDELLKTILSSNAQFYEVFVFNENLVDETVRYKVRIVKDKIEVIRQGENFEEEIEPTKLPVYILLNIYFKVASK